MTARGTAQDIRVALEEMYAHSDHDGPYATWSPSQQDMEYVTDKLGYKPTKKEWAEAGIANINDLHCSSHG